MKKLLFLLVIAIIVSSFCQAETSTPLTKDKILKVLVIPSYNRGYFSSRERLTVSDIKKVFYEDVDGDGRKELVVWLQKKFIQVSVLSKKKDNYQQVWASSAFRGAGTDFDVRVRELYNDGSCEIIIQGISGLGGQKFCYIYKFTHGKYILVNSLEGIVQFVDLGGNAIPEALARTECVSGGPYLGEIFLEVFQYNKKLKKYTNISRRYPALFKPVGKKIRILINNYRTYPDLTTKKIVLSQLFIALGKVYFYQGDLYEAKIAFNRGLKLMPSLRDNVRSFYSQNDYRSPF